MEKHGEHPLIMELKDVSRRFARAGEAREILDGVSLSLHEGEIVGLLGRSGSGKSTILRAITGLIGTWSGLIEVDGEKVSETLNRSELYQAQTPQTFRLGDLRRNYYSLSEGQNKKLTDTCSVFTACNEDIYLVVGDAMNFKITTDSDLKMANALAELSEK